MILWFYILYRIYIILFIFFLLLLFFFFSFSFILIFLISSIPPSHLLLPFPSPRFWAQNISVPLWSCSCLVLSEFPGDRAQVIRGLMGPFAVRTGRWSAVISLQNLMKGEKQILNCTRGVRCAASPIGMVLFSPWIFHPKKGAGCTWDLRAGFCFGVDLFMLRLWTEWLQSACWMPFG